MLIVLIVAAGCVFGIVLKKSNSNDKTVSGSDSQNEVIIRDTTDKEEHAASESEEQPDAADTSETKKSQNADDTNVSEKNTNVDQQNSVKDQKRPADQKEVLPDKSTNAGTEKTKKNQEVSSETKKNQDDGGEVKNDQDSNTKKEAQQLDENELEIIPAE